MWDCAVIGCPNGRYIAQKSLTRVSFHVFPHPVREANRFRRWLTIINNPRLLRMNPMSVFKSVRVCRRHFGPDCFNGECRKLLPIAVPSLNLPEVRPVALVQPMDAVGDELERLLREERRQQLKRHGAIETPMFDDETNDCGKRSKIGISLLSSDAEEAECSTGDRFIDRIIEFDVKQEYDDASLASDLRLSTVCDAGYGLSSFTGMVMSRSADLDTLKQVEILNEPPETLLNDSPASEDGSNHVPIEKGYEQLVREFASEASNDEQEQQIQRNAQCMNRQDDKSLPSEDDSRKRNSTSRFSKGLPCAALV